MTVSIEALYRTMSTELLRVLRRAFLSDIQAGADRAFCQHRIDLIERVLEQRQPYVEVPNEQLHGRPVRIPKV